MGANTEAGNPPQRAFKNNIENKLYANMFSGGYFQNYENELYVKLLSGNYFQKLTNQKRNPVSKLRKYFKELSGNNFRNNFVSEYNHVLQTAHLQVFMLDHNSGR